MFQETFKESVAVEKRKQMIWIKYVQVDMRFGDSNGGPRRSGSTVARRDVTTVDHASCSCIGAFRSGFEGMPNIPH